MRGRGRVTEYVYSFARADDLDEFRTAVTCGLRSVVEGDLASYTEVDLDSGRAFAPLDPLIDASALVGAFGRLAHQHPLVTRPRCVAETISDYLSARHFHALELYAEVYRPLGAEDQLGINLPHRQGQSIGLVVNRSRRSFTAHDRETLDLLRPVLARSYSRALARQRARERLDELACARDDPDGLLAIGEDGKIDFASDGSRSLLRRYFLTSAPLPAELRDWLEAERHGRPARLTVSGQGGCLDVALLPTRWPEPRVIELRERRETSLTSREDEIMARVAQGESNAEIARALGLSRSTVENHLHAIYRKLGVGNRTAAAAAVARH